MNEAEHLEKYLGQMDQGWSSRSLPGVKVCLFRNQPTDGVVTLSTLGLSHSVLAMSEQRTVRQELLLAIRDDGALEDWCKALLDVADHVRTEGYASLRGDVIAIGERIARGSAARAVYASIPVVFPDGLATLKDSSPPTVFVWLIPVLPTETRFIEKFGWSKFEDRLEATDPDLFDPHRGSVV